MSEPKQIIEWIRDCSRAFDESPEFQAIDNAIRTAFSEHPSNTSLETVLLKVTLLDSLYTSRVRDVVARARHITTADLDRQLARGDGRAVEAVGAAISERGQKRGAYVFATKYCHWHKPSLFPICDSLVIDMLGRLKGPLGMRAPISDSILRTPSGLKQAIDELRSTVGFTMGDYKKVDQGLWLAGRALNGRLPEGAPDWCKAQFDRRGDELRALLPTP